MKLKVLAIVMFAVLITSCGSDEKKPEKDTAPVAVKETITDPLKDKGIGPVTQLVLGEIDNTMVAEGKALFKTKCAACHKMSKRFVGPPLKGITEKRTPEWIMNMILNPEEMVQKNPIAKKLLEEYLSPMANQSLTEKEARLILEYFRTKK